MLHKLEIVSAVIAGICGIGIIVFSCIDITGRELAMAIFGIVMILVALVFMYFYSRRPRMEKNKNLRTPHK